MLEAATRSRASTPGPTPAFPSEATLDAATIATLREGDSTDGANFRLVATSFAREAESALLALEIARAAGDADALRQAAHKLGGTSGTLGAMPLHRLCSEVEIHARAGRFAEACSPLPMLSAEVARVRAALDEIASPH